MNAYKSKSVQQRWRRNKVIISLPRGVLSEMGKKYIWKQYRPFQFFLQEKFEDIKRGNQKPYIVEEHIPFKVANILHLWS